jgi:hypothetical protein
MTAICTNNNFYIRNIHIFLQNCQMQKNFIGLVKVSCYLLC